jgi:hypothetical protein
MSEPKRGRPPLDSRQPSVPVTVRVPTSQYDEFFQRAQRDRTNVSTVIRRQLSAADDESDD